ncbi:MAG TPA: lanthionine synthetase LanC family protein, partial [Acidimicrobiales bacterium]|nr:lanthionine synthetase LanC family protein [Acidimicrobiales bacterium]
MTAPVEEPTSVEPSSQGPPFEELAVELGERLCREAIWHEDRCTWLGDEVDPSGRAGMVVHRAMGADLYNGTAGIGWFLAHLARRTGDAGHRRTAAGALRHALSRWDGAHPGLYTGQAGIALAAATAGGAMGEAAVVAAGRERGASLAVAAEPDLLAGAAGTVLALLALGRVGAAVEVGDALLARAVRSLGGWC